MSTSSRQKRNFWYETFAPPETGTSVKDREMHLRGRVASVIGPLAFALALLGIPAAISLGSLLQLTIIGAVLLVFIGDIISNRFGAVSLGSLLIVMASEVGLVSSVTIPTQLSITTLSLYALLVQPLSFSAALFTGYSVFTMLAINLIVIATTFLVKPHDTLITSAIQQGQGPTLLITYLTLQFVLTAVLYVKNRNVRELFQQSEDEAEQTARYAQHNAFLQHRAQEKAMLEQDIARINDIGMKLIAHPDKIQDITLPRPQSSILLPVTHALGRILHLLQVERIQQSGKLSRLSSAIHTASSQLEAWPEQTIRLTGTELDVLLVKLNALKTKERVTPLPQSWPREK